MGGRRDISKCSKKEVEGKGGERGLLLVIVLGEEKGFYDTPECIMYMGANSIFR